jgi:linoleoyl-CoA desaturase
MEIARGARSKATTAYNLSLKPFCSPSQLATTADWAVGSHAINYLTGGLNHQVVHHLYPNVPSYAYPEIAKLLKEEFGDLYNDMGWSFIHALRSNTMYLSSMGSKQL